MKTEEEQLVERGDAAQFLLENSMFALAINTLVEQGFQAFATGKLEDAAQREAVFHQSRATTEIVGLLRHWVSVRDEINLKYGDIRQEEGMDHE